MTQRRPSQLSGKLLGRKVNRTGPRLAQPSPLEPGAAETGAQPRPLIQRKPAPAAPASAAKDMAGQQAGGAKTDARCADQRIRVSLRLDPERHLRLKLASVHTHKTSQQLMTEALDLYLTRLGRTVEGGDCPCMSRSSRVDRQGPQEVGR